jgi:putative membrane protein
MKKMIGAGIAIAAVLALSGTAGGASKTPKRLNALDVSWLSTSMQGDLFEIRGGKMAQRRGTTARVRALGRRLASDHAKSYAEDYAVAKALGLDTPNTPTASERWELSDLAHRYGADFNRAYASLEVADHTQDILETKEEIQRGYNDQIKGLAKDDLPMLKMHLGLSTRALAQTGWLR